MLCDFKLNSEDQRIFEVLDKDAVIPSMFQFKIVRFTGNARSVKHYVGTWPIRIQERGQERASKTVVIHENSPYTRAVQLALTEDAGQVRLLACLRPVTT